DRSAGGGTRHPVAAPGSVGDGSGGRSVEPAPARARRAAGGEASPVAAGLASRFAVHVCNVARAHELFVRAIQRDRVLVVFSRGICIQNAARDAGGAPARGWVGNVAYGAMVRA